MSFNPLQPVRPRIHPETGEILRHTTFPELRGKGTTICDFPSQITQCRLYRAACQGHIPRQVPIADVYNWCFADVQHVVTKTQMGRIATRSVIYEPRLLVNNKTVKKPTMTYTFHTDLDLRFGLEWMICTWLRKFLNSNAPSEEHITTAEQMNEELAMLGNSDDRNYLEVYEEGLREFVMPEPDWHKLCSHLREELPLTSELTQPRIERVPPRDLSQPKPIQKLKLTPNQ